MAGHCATVRTGKHGGERFSRADRQGEAAGSARARYVYIQYKLTSLCQPLSGSREPFPGYP